MNTLAPAMGSPWELTTRPTRSGPRGEKAGVPGGNGASGASVGTFGAEVSATIGLCGCDAVRPGNTPPNTTASSAQTGSSQTRRAVASALITRSLPSSPIAGKGIRELVEWSGGAPSLAQRLPMSLSATLRQPRTARTQETDPRGLGSVPDLCWSSPPPSPRLPGVADAAGSGAGEVAEPTVGRQAVVGHWVHFERVLRIAAGGAQTAADAARGKMLPGLGGRVDGDGAHRAFASAFGAIAALGPVKMRQEMRWRGHGGCIELILPITAMVVRHWHWPTAKVR